MCGFVGFVDAQTENKSKVIKEMADQIIHRGPDQDDYYIDDTGRILIDFIYIDENNIPISEVHTKSLYNFDIHFHKKLN